MSMIKMIFLTYSHLGKWKRPVNQYRWFWAFKNSSGKLYKKHCSQQSLWRFSSKKLQEGSPEVVGKEIVFIFAAATGRTGMRYALTTSPGGESVDALVSNTNFAARRAGSDSGALGTYESSFWKERLFSFSFIRLSIPFHQPLAWNSWLFYGNVTWGLKNHVIWSSNFQNYMHGFA